VDRLRVLTLNIWNRQGPWEQRARLIRAGLAELEPDLIGLQEVLHHDSLPDDQAQELARDLGYYVAWAPAWPIGFGLHLGNAVLSRWPIVDAQNFALPVEEGEGTRSLLYALVDAPCGRVPFFCTHLSWQLHYGHVRERQVAFIAERIRALAPVDAAPAAPAFPPILVGDFNAEPEADEIRWLKGLTSRLGRSVYFCDCFAAAGDGSPGYTFARANRFAAQNGEPSRRLDYVFVRGPDRQRRGEPLLARVILDRPDADVFASDHYGVYVELRATPAPTGTAA
jgi:endonuclease/exonuclease/phosphatase family metal-dependent hydrolase